MKVLLADENSQRAGALARLLEADTSLEVILLEAHTSLMDAVRSHAPDIVLVDISRADRDALDSVRALSASGLERPVALFVDEDDEALMEDAFAAGVCSYNVLDTPVKNVKPLLRSAIALYDRFRKTNAELLAARKTLSDRETIDRAKFLFMKQERCREEDAYRWLRKQAMQTSRKIIDVATEYLAHHTRTPKA
ncbi:ANTAR domain-containing protein [Acetobacter farinalis]|uniref:ANTAR domain-containing protein n=1 Tax=Acetobacter farinalis TaxID=1260984 RepID=A0ABT3Q8N2_9PROT|nr:ANTAR domain-containing protein [Acetobacter farinalis]MCX2561650.1 ANTAR domain-containing protein [Acetobacter farinalis]NHO30123.1 ANTAR domain-containing protein [Acetobacter farinalis]